MDRTSCAPGDTDLRNRVVNLVAECENAVWSDGNCHASTYEWGKIPRCFDASHLCLIGVFRLKDAGLNLGESRGNICENVLLTLIANTK